MRKTVGLLGFLAALVGITCGWEFAHTSSSSFLSHENIRNLLTFFGLFGILSLGQSFVIITGGIDLSVGSLVGLIGVWTAMLMDRGEGLNPFIVIALMLGLSVLIGAWHGFLITKARMQPFVVTLCGLFFYRGLARLLAKDATQGFGTAYEKLKWLGRGTMWDVVSARDGVTRLAETAYERILDSIAAPFLILLFLGILVGAFMHLTATGRHLFALGANEEAARFSGIRTDALKVLAYILCSLITCIGGILMAFKVNSMQPTAFGSFYELYAIAGAVLGGCSLRGGSGNVAAVIVGAAIIRTLNNVVNILGIPSQLEYVVIGGAILLGVFLDEFFARRSAMRVKMG